tara:strand:- start:10556 stop:11170 length:615 start_codon:yes stop_codon:yes gene_type:complete
MNEIFEGFSDSDEEILQPKKLKQIKQKRIISDERRQQLIENLKKGRITSAKNRAKKKNVKEILKRKKTDYIDKVIRDEVLEQETKKKSYNDLEQELENLKKKLNSTKINVNQISNEKTFKKSSEQKPIENPIEKTFKKSSEQKPIENPIEQVVLKPVEKPIVNQYAENLKNNVRQRFTAKDIINDQLQNKKNRQYGGSVTRYNY